MNNTVKDKDYYINYYLNKLELAWVRCTTCFQFGIIGEKTANLMYEIIIDEIQSNRFLKITDYRCSQAKCLYCLYKKIKDRRFRSKLIDYGLGLIKSLNEAPLSSNNYFTNIKELSLDKESL